MGASIIALALHNKYSLHLPLYRQIKEFERIGLEGLSEGVLCNWVRAAADALEPLWKARHELMLDSAALHIDETPIRCLKSDKINGYMWAISSADTGSTLYYWKNSRNANTLDYLLRHGQQTDGCVYEEAILGDGYGGYESWIKNLADEQKPQWQVCWAHVRQKFVEAAGNSNDPCWSMKMVELIRPLYTIERTLRESKAPPEQRLQERMEKSRPIVEDFRFDGNGGYKTRRCFLLTFFKLVSLHYLSWCSGNKTCPKHHRTIIHYLAGFGSYLHENCVSLLRCLSRHKLGDARGGQRMRGQFIVELSTFARAPLTRLMT